MRKAFEKPKFTWEELDLISQWHYLNDPPRELIRTQESVEWDGDQRGRGIKVVRETWDASSNAR
jgi:hypothetical protein